MLEREEGLPGSGSLAELNALDANITDRLATPQRALVVTFPFRHDEYSRVETVYGYRVQHVTSMGPTKGGIRYAEDVNLGETDPLLPEDEVEDGDLFDAPGTDLSSKADADGDDER